MSKQPLAPASWSAPALVFAAALSAGCGPHVTDAGPEGPQVVEGASCTEDGTVDWCNGDTLVNCFAATGQGVSYDCATWCTGIGQGYTGGSCAAQDGDDACACTGETPVTEGGGCVDLATSDVCAGDELVWCDQGLGRRDDCYQHCTDLGFDYGPCVAADGDDACDCDTTTPAVAIATVCDSAQTVNDCLYPGSLVRCTGNVGVLVSCVDECLATSTTYTDGDCVPAIGDDACECSSTPVVAEGGACDPAATLDWCDGTDLVYCDAASGMGARTSCLGGGKSGYCGVQTGDDVCVPGV